MMTTVRWTLCIVGLLLACAGPLYSEQVSQARKMLNVDDIARVLDDQRWVFVDTRATDAFNGWRLDGVKRGGHLPRAVDFPAGWLDSDREDKAVVLAAALAAKGIDPHRHIVLCGSSNRTRQRVADYLNGLGFQKLYDFDVRAWAEDETRPLVRHKNFHLIVPPSIVKRLLEGELPETFERAKRIQFVEVSWGDESASYAKGHVPRSFHVNTDHFEPPPKWILGDTELLQRFAVRYGFHVDDTVILSGEDPTASYRLAVVLRYMGVADVRVLNGGFRAWQSARYPVETISTMPTTVDRFGANIPARPQLVADQERVRRGLETSGAFVLVDTRNWQEFTGKTSGYSYHVHKGRIPGSVYGQADFRGKDSLVPYRNIDQTMRNPEEILTLWRQSGIDPRRHLSFMCGGGWRAAEVLTFAQVMGLSDTSLYSDGWIGWSNDPENDRWTPGGETGTLR